MHRQIGRPLAWRIRRTLTVGIAVLTALLLQSNSHLYVQSSDIIAEGDPMPSIAHPPGSDDAELLTRSGHEFNGPNFVRGNKSFSKRNRLNHDIDPTRSLPSPSVADSQMSIQAATKVDQVVEGFGFNDNAAEIGFFLIPPDPHGAVGKNRVIAIGNAIIECRTREGDLKWRDALRDFFAPLTPTTLIFDPKIVYDQYEDRFVAVALVMAGTATVSPSNISRILVAVSKDGNPRTPTSADWYYHAIDAKTLIGTLERWADYPGFAVDEEAIYINANMFSFSTGSFGGVRLWIIDKGALGGFYAGGPAGVTAHNPYATAGIATTTQPAHVFGDGGGGPTTGTYLVSYSGLSDGVDEYVQIVRVDNPLGTTSFAQQFVNVGNLESFPGGGVLLDAPQLGGSALIEVNDRRALNAVWIDNELWMTAELRPNSGPDLNQTTAHWWNLDTTVPALIALADQGNIGGEDIAPGTYTYYPAVAVNRDGFAAFGFSASAPTIYAGAFVTGRAATDAAGTVQSSQVVHSGVDFYLRRFSANPAARNRWGDFTSVVVDPTNNDFFWVFNEFADVQGTPLVAGDGQGRWRMTWARYRSN
jgi:hypothetical protein